MWKNSKRWKRVNKTQALLNVVKCASGCREPLDKTAKTFTLSRNKGCKQSGKSLVKKVLVLNYGNSFI